MEDPKELKRRPRMLWLVAALFAAPLLLAMVLVSRGWHPLQTRNAGELLSPPIALEDVPLLDSEGAALPWAVGERGWSILVLAPAACAGDCAALYDTLHRVWLTQGRHADRVRVLWSGPLPAGAVEYAGLQPAVATRALLEQMPHRTDDGTGDAIGNNAAGDTIDDASGVGTDSATDDATGIATGNAAAPVYLVDGRGFLALSYAPGFDPSGLRKDLARLLK